MGHRAGSFIKWQNWQSTFLNLILYVHSVSVVSWSSQASCIQDNDSIKSVEYHVSDTGGNTGDILSRKLPVQFPAPTFQTWVLYLTVSWCVSFSVLTLQDARVTRMYLICGGNCTVHPSQSTMGFLSHFFLAIYYNHISDCR